jgi:lipopolysaccharide/colanic/teichoic acid biosynthesis glycosyltransferase
MRRWSWRRCRRSCLLPRRRCGAKAGPGVLFRQQRVGLDVREFTMFKFRSLKPHDDEESCTRWTIWDDARLGSVGKFIRRTSIDELARLFNVLPGDMNMVASRHERPYFVRQLHRRLFVRGAAPGAGRPYRLGRSERATRRHVDRGARLLRRSVIDNWSLWLDVKILLHTLSVVLREEPGSSPPRSSCTPAVRRRHTLGRSLRTSCASGSSARPGPWSERQHDRFGGPHYPAT